MTMVKLRSVEVGDRQRICDFLHQHDERILPHAWCVIFDYVWLQEKPGFGFVLEDSGRIVGFIGAIYSHRLIAGRMERVCDLGSWVVLPQYRKKSLALLFSLMRMADDTMVSLLPSKNVQKILASLGFHEIQQEKLLFIPLSHPFSLFLGQGCVLITRENQIVTHISDWERQIYEDHKPYNCRTLLLRTPNDGNCFILFQKRWKMRLPVVEIIHLSQPALFMRFLERIKLTILFMERALLLAVDARLLVNPVTKVYRHPSIVMVHSNTLNLVHLQSMDNLYSEKVLLKI